MTPPTVVTGTGSPVTVFAPGRDESIARTRPFGSGVRGTRVFFQYTDHPSTEPAADLRRVADDAGATRAFGASLGAAALIRLLAETPDRFDRVLLALPARLAVPLAEMRRVGAPVLVIGQRADDVHPEAVARETAAAFPHARLEIFPAGGLLTAHRDELRTLITGFLE